MPTVPSAHVHVTEREGDGTFEDCTWCSGLEWFRLVYDASKPATHAEAESLRIASGEPMTGGSNLGNLAVGIKARYGVTIPDRVNNNVLPQPGQAAVVQGSMKAFGPHDPLSKWDPSFDGSHAVLVMNLDGTFYWCDPEAPTNANVPVVISKGDLLKFINAFPGQSVLGTIQQAVPEESGMDTLVRNLTGKAGTIKPQSNIRVVPRIAATKVRTTSAAETHPLVGTVKGDADPGNGGNTEWVVWYEGADARYTAIDNVPSIVAIPVGVDDGYTKATQDRAVADAVAAEQAKVPDYKQQAVTAERARIIDVLGLDPLT